MSTNTYNEDNKKKNFLSVLLGVYVISIGVGLPLVIRDRYFDILRFKYYYYCFCTIGLIVLIAGYFFTAKIKDTVFWIKNFSFHSFIRRCTLLDLFVFLYWLIAVISTFTSDYLYEAFWGNEGRYTGLFLITWYVLSYYCISRFWRYKDWYIDAILIAGTMVSLFGITDYFYMDIFGFKALMLPEQRDIFTSTLGNINTYTAYVGIITAISTVLFTTVENSLKMILYFICMVISFFAIIMGVSDNAYLSLMALFGLLPLYLFKNKTGVQRYLVTITAFFTVAQCIDWINTFMKDKVLGIDSAFNIVIGFAWLHYLVFSLWAVILIWYLYDWKNKTKVKDYGNKYVYTWLTIIIALFLSAIYVFYDCNIAGNTDRYSSVSNYILINDDWGTHRGYIWRKAMECFLNLPFWKKIIGYGPETFGILLLSKTMNNPYNEIFDNAHNEYLHTLITVGISGLIFYISFILLFIRNCFKEKSKNIYIVAVAFGVICYSTQAFVNLNLPIVTPMLWLLMGIGSTKYHNETM